MSVFKKGYAAIKARRAAKEVMRRKVEVEAAVKASVNSGPAEQKGKVATAVDELRIGNASPNARWLVLRGLLVAALGGLLNSLNSVAKAFGYDVGVDEAQVAAIAGFIGDGLYVWVVFDSFRAFKNIGLLPKSGTSDQH